MIPALSPANRSMQSGLMGLHQLTYIHLSLHAVFQLLTLHANNLYFSADREKKSGKLFLNTNSFILVQMGHTIANVR